MRPGQILPGLFNRMREEETFMNYDEAMAYIHSKIRKGAAPGLQRIRELLEKLGNPEKKLKFVHIAGTNGKGSTAAMTASILRKAGYRTGLYTSPFIFRFNERMNIDGEDITDEDLAEVTAYVRPFADSMEDQPTEFELVTAIALEYFARKHCDIVSFEVGLGGTVDATNAINAPEVAVICTIGLEHTAVLGHTLEEIAEKKAGIIKAGCDVAVYRGCESVERVYEETCRSLGARLHKAPFDSLVLREHSFRGQTFDCGARKNLFTPLLGEHQLKNAAVVLTAMECLISRGWKISEEHIREGLRDTSWPGRFEVMGSKPDFIVDGGHNPQCMEALRQNVKDYLANREITAITGIMADKDYSAMYADMAPYIARFVAVTPNNPRALPAEDLKKVLSRFGKPVTACDTVEAGVREAIRQAGEDGVVLSFGSLFLVGDVRQAVLYGE